MSCGWFSNIRSVSARLNLAVDANTPSGLVAALARLRMDGFVYFLPTPKEQAQFLTIKLRADKVFVGV
jgi:hypothetical protein